jgi:prevent-host-death family protein
MSITVNVHDAKTHLSRLLERAHNGEEIILAKAGKPYARLLPLASANPQRVPGRLKGQIDASGFFDALPDEELDAWEAGGT